MTRSAVQYTARALAEDPTDSALVFRTNVVVGKTGRLLGQLAIQLHIDIGVTPEYSVSYLTIRLTAIKHT